MATDLATVRLCPGQGNDTHLIVETLEGAPPTLVFLHGMTSTRVGHKSETLLDRAREWGHGYARFDFRGHGESGGEVQSLTMTNLIEDVAAVVDHVGRSVLVGSSMGGLAAAWYAARHPTAIDALVLLSPAFGYLPEMARQSDRYELRPADSERASIVMGAAVVQDARRYDEVALPAQLRMPVCIFHGSEDQTVDDSVSAEFCRRIGHRDKEFWLMEGGSHSLNEATTTIWDRVGSFLQEWGLVARSW